MSDGSPDLLKQDAAIAADLAITWGPFFGRFGRLREVQRRAIPPILAGKDCLVVAPTASGKTEAACAPLVERSFQRRHWTILYISPTRALVNDLYERIVGPLSQLGVSVRRRTGDHHDPVGDIANVILTTPESFDSLLCRGRDEHAGHILGFVTSVVLDEVHLLQGTARGEQLRWLLERLRRLRQQMVETGRTKTPNVQVVALSATVPNAEAVASMFLGPTGETTVVGGGRQIDVVEADASLPTVEDSLPRYLSALSVPEKVLVFSNSRKRVDALARALAGSLEPLGYQVRAHHGSLSQPERESTEAAAKSESRIVICATMTLEIGVDIGDIDLVVLDSPAPSVSSLLQRLGRGNRRTGTTRLMMCSGSLAEAIIHGAMLEAARAGDLGEREDGPQFAVARQQTASYVFQSPTRSRPRPQLAGLANAVLPTLRYDSLLDHLESEGELQEDASGVRLGEIWQEQTTRGDIHSTIEDAGGYEVVDAKTGTQIGKGIRSQSGRGMGIAGKLLEVRAWDDFRIVVRKAADDAAAKGEWSYVSQAWMRGAGQPQAVRRYLGFPGNLWPGLALEGALCVFHFGGSRRRAVLQLVFELAGRAPVRIDDWAVWLPADGYRLNEPPAWLRNWQVSQLEILVSASLPRLERILARPHANKALPTPLRVEEVIGWLGLESERLVLAEAVWSDARPAESRAALETIAAAIRR